MKMTADGLTRNPALAVHVPRAKSGRVPTPCVRWARDSIGVEMVFLKSERILTQDIPMHRAHNGHLGNVRHMLWHDLERK